MLSVQCPHCSSRFSCTVTPNKSKKKVADKFAEVSRFDLSKIEWEKAGESALIIGKRVSGKTTLLGHLVDVYFSMENTYPSRFCHRCVMAESPFAAAGCRHNITLPGDRQKRHMVSSLVADLDDPGLTKKHTESEEMAHLLSTTQVLMTAQVMPDFPRATRSQFRFIFWRPGYEIDDRVFRLFAKSFFDSKEQFSSFVKRFFMKVENPHAWLVLDISDTQADRKDALFWYDCRTITKKSTSRKKINVKIDP